MNKNVIDIDKLTQQSYYFIFILPNKKNDFTQIILLLSKKGYK